MHFSGLAGMPRNSDYPMPSLVGTMYRVLAHIYQCLQPSFFLVVIFEAFIKSRKAEKILGVGATTFEWKLSPPPFHSYDDLPSQVGSFTRYQ